MKMVMGAILAVVAMYLAFAVGTGRTLPFSLSATAGLWLAVAVGMAACGVGGIGDVLARAGNNWGNPWVLAGIAFGVLAMAAVALAATGTTLGVVGSANQWMIVLAAIIGVKLVIATAQAVTVVAASAVRG